ncbi:hypothetical protein IMG5_157320 [Ichthyophthirius multifiliis]|uniref:Uncharacterized protein n=1 Tax=Ichthyophthirius multifiliis TaxID=5932 RepID=G0QZJ8_ICHMU|nr:hypothetical protein IMG5_157320 [Ichthyophthirius multifiliis]EGR29359.1 hypothetical protein IMG5_157320 [Ichthyophthirius multifiliis]|eukprot:XP_004030595.1 hypothetical protein IMG5_157320 [Ichthyophthirius multifiliis]
MQKQSILSLIFFLLLIQFNAEVTKITIFSDVVKNLKQNPNSLITLMVTRLKECDRCKIGNEVLHQYAELTDGIVLTYLLDCEKIWEVEQDRVRIPACDPIRRQELPNLTFFQPDYSELDIYNKKNKKIHKDIPYQGVFSPDALIQRTKELIPFFQKMSLI